MHSFPRRSLLQVCRFPACGIASGRPSSGARLASLNSAISQGIRKDRFLKSSESGGTSSFSSSDRRPAGWERNDRYPDRDRRGDTGRNGPSSSRSFDSSDRHSAGRNDRYPDSDRRGNTGRNSPSSSRSFDSSDRPSAGWERRGRYPNRDRRSNTGRNTPSSSWGSSPKPPFAQRDRVWHKPQADYRPKNDWSGGRRASDGSQIQRNDPWSPTDGYMKPIGDSLYYQSPRNTRRRAKKGSKSERFHNQPLPPKEPTTRVFRVAPNYIPYTTPMSEFVYGASAVQAAVLSGRRKPHTLYIFDPSESANPKWDLPEMRTLQKYVSAAGGRVKCTTGKTWSDCLDEMSEGRPHNGVVLEASPLPKVPAVSFQPVNSLPATHFGVNLAAQSEEEAAVNCTDGRLPLTFQKNEEDNTSTDNQQNARYPFTLLLDGILDPGNVGAIIRSAYYFGADAIAFSSRNSAPISPVTIKASAGAAENIPLITITNPASFIDTSRANGWRFFAAEPPAPASDTSNNTPRRSDYINPSAGGTPVLSPSSLSTELLKSPCVLMLGGEGSGLTGTLKRKADSFISIPGPRIPESEIDPAGVDSLNVSVASGLLCEAFLRNFPVERKAVPREPNSPERDRHFSREHDDPDRLF